MPLFRKNHAPEYDAPPPRNNSLFSRNRGSADYYDEPPPRHNSLFSRNRGTPAHHDAPARRSTSSGNSPKRGLFSRRRSSSSLSSSDMEYDDRRGSSKISDMFHRGPREDSSVKMARKHVNAAEGAERDADRAFGRAKMQLGDANRHVKHLEKEADAEARRARQKQKHAHDLNKRTKPLGRKFY